MPKDEHKFIAVDPEKCTGCGICEYICSFEKEGVFNPFKARIRTVRIYPATNMPMACRLCEDAACVMACPRDALKQSEENGVILIDEDRCNGCGWCIQACEFGAITLHPEKGVPIVCDLCKGEPKCVNWCPEKALELMSRDTLARKTRVAAVKKLTNL